MAEFKNVSVVLGAVTETQLLRETVSTILKICDHKDLCEIIIACAVNISDESKKVVSELACLDTDVPIVIYNQKRKGFSEFSEFMETVRGSHCLLVASDMAFDLECITAMIEKVKTDGNLIVSSSRWLKDCKFIEYGKIKKIMNFSAQVFLRILFGAKMTDFTNCFQIVPTELYKAVAWENDGFPFFMELILKPLRLGYKFTEVPTNCYPRKEGKSNNSFKQTAMYFPAALHIRFMKKSDIVKKDSPLYQKLVK